MFCTEKVIWLSFKVFSQWNKNKKVYQGYILIIKDFLYGLINFSASGKNLVR